MLAGILRYRHFVASAIASEFRSRYARSRLGFMWAVLHPLAQALIFAIILAEVLGARLPGVESTVAYPIFLLSGIAAWGLFSEILNRSTTVFIEYSSALKKIAFPRLCLPFIVWGAAVINHGLLVLAILVIFAFLGHMPGIAIVVLPLGALLISLLAFGLGIVLGILNVFSRDVGQVVGVVLQMWFWLTPIVYPPQIVPSALAPILAYNPMASLVAIYQDALLFDRFPDLAPLMWPAALAMAMVALSFVVFRRASPDLVDAL